MKIKKGDSVKILSGKDRGKRGKVLRVLPRENQILVDGLNLKKKHRRSRRQDRKGEIILLPAPLAASAAALICPKCAKPTRVGYRLGAAGIKERICRKCKETV
ncbi:MAG: 50S ribosomal protein L24 [Candidatus Sungbacteria bacterium]|uniref:Large ribosomal subunit protein uL24 n=1 Tax=Candidatus Sungiibacteriota bacterium TaxID=2750080 RepID=A0A932YXD9_9BACT|nr:50S ribosomal protein L24 [Candidatus Sungbacteria bacterium]